MYPAGRLHIYHALSTGQILADLLKRRKNDPGKKTAFRNIPIRVSKCRQLTAANSHELKAARTVLRIIYIGIPSS